MTTATTTLRRAYPRQVRIDAGSVELARVATKDRADVLRFARGLSEQDLLFLRIDITREEVVDEWIRSQADDQRVTLLARDGGKLVGYGGVNREALSWTRHMGEIRVIVGESHRGRGLGAALAKEIFAVARDLGLRKVIARMPVRQEGARRMFERIGFHAEALLADWVVDRNDRTHDLLVMSYDVTSFTSD